MALHFGFPHVTHPAEDLHRLVDDVVACEHSDPLMHGGSCIVAPTGDIVAGRVYGKKYILYADLDLDDITRGKYDLDVVGHYARPDIFSLHIDERPRATIVSTQPDADEALTEGPTSPEIVR